MKPTITGDYNRSSIVHIEKQKTIKLYEERYFEMANIRINDVLAVAQQAKASDVHLTVALPPKMRVNGHLISMENFPVLTADDTLEMLLAITTDHQRELFNSKGELDMSFAAENLGRYRVNAFRQRGSVAMALRAVNTVVPSPEQLGLPHAFVDLYTRKRGLILVTGPTGSGKSTTCYTVLNELNRPEVNIITVEDPVEANVAGIKSVTIIHGKGTGALRAAVHDFLKRHKNVKNYRLGTYGEGEAGVTVVELK